MKKSEWKAKAKDLRRKNKILADELTMMKYLHQECHNDKLNIPWGVEPPSKKEVSKVLDRREHDAYDVIPPYEDLAAAGPFERVRV
jgi:hypothetical protein